MRQQYLDFERELHSMAEYLQPDDTCKRLKITQQQHEDLTGKYMSYSEIFGKYTRPETKTSAIVQEMETVYKVTHKWIASLRQTIKHNNDDALTDTDYMALFIHKNKTTKTRHTHIEQVPNIEVKSQAKGWVYLGIFVAGSEIKTKPKLPEFVTSVQLNWCFTDSKTTPTEIKEFQKIISTASPKIEIDSENDAKFCHVVAHYLLPTGVSSLPSQVLSFAASTI